MNPSLIFIASKVLFYQAIKPMLFLLSKTLYLLFLPFTWIFLLILWTGLTKSRRQRKIAIRLTILCLIIFTNPALQNQAFLCWEIPPTLFQDISENEYDVGIVLTGFSQPYKSPTDRVHFLKGSGRLLHAVRLYKEKKIKKILVSGTSDFDMTGNEINPERSLKNVFLYCGVPEKDLILEPKSKNTHENAVNSAQILNENFPNQNYLLITSAFHMRRAKACFDHEKIPTTVFSTDFYSVDATAKIIPSPRVLMQWHILFKEWIGIVAYRFLGYI